MHRLKASGKRIFSWIKMHRTRTLISCGLVLVLIGSGVAYALIHQPVPRLDTTLLEIKKRAPKVPHYSLLTGEDAGSDAALSKPVTAIMIENSLDARPQSGLKQAEVVYEAIAEGGITRLLAVYQQHKPQLIGPVRSVRPYYLDWVVPYNASIAHVGGSATALSEVRNGNYRDLDQFFNAGSFWRASDRPAPHNVYTSFEKLDALNQAKGFSTSAPLGFSRADKATSSSAAASSISVHISGGSYDSSYIYDTKSHSYNRSQGGAPHVDREQGQISPKVVIVMKADYSTRFEDTTREVIQTAGSGPVTIFQNGMVSEGTWQRPSRDGQYSFVATDGTPISLNRGQTWITIVPKSTGGVSWQ